MMFVIIDHPNINKKQNNYYSSSNYFSVVI